MPIYEIHADGDVQFTGTLEQIKVNYGISRLHNDNNSIILRSRLKMLDIAVDIDDVIDIICKLWNNDYMAVRVG
jgi:hypothetical protein